MTQEEYLKYYNNIEKDENEESDVVESLKKVGKHVLAGAASAIPGSYLIGGAKAVPSGIISGAINGGITALLSDEKDKSLTLPIYSNLLLGGIVGSYHKINDMSDKINKMNPAQNQNSPGRVYNASQNFSCIEDRKKYDKISDFLSNYSEEGLKNFSEKLFNFMVLGELGAMNAIKNAPEDEKIKYAALGGGSGLAGGATLGTLGGLSGALTGAAGGFTMGKGWGRIGSAFAGGVMGGFGGATAGGIIGSKLGSDEMVKHLKKQKKNEEMKKLLMKKYLSDEEKKIVSRFIAAKNKERARAIAQDLVDNYNVGFSNIQNFGTRSAAGDVGRTAGNMILAPFRWLRGLIAGTADSVKKTTKDSLGAGVRAGRDHGKALTAIGAAGAAGTGITATGIGGYALLKNGGKEDGGSGNLSVENIIKNIKNLEPEASALGGALIGSAAGSMNENPLIGGLAGATTGGLAHFLAKKGGLENSTGLAIGLGASALGGYLASKMSKKKNEDAPNIKKGVANNVVHQKRGRGRPKKVNVEDPIDESLVQDPFNTMRTKEIGLVDY